jgi:hypothetical protein
MPQNRAYELMRIALETVLPSMEASVRLAKSSSAKKNLMTQIGQIKEALKAAEHAGPPLPQSTERAS